MKKIINFIKRKLKINKQKKKNNKYSDKHIY